MKFAKELEREAVPEWRVKYLNYKLGKKYVKEVGRAINRANTTPTLRKRGGDNHHHHQHGTPAGLFRLTRTFTPTGPPHGVDAPPYRDDDDTSVRSSPGPVDRTRTIIEDGEREGLATSPGSGMQYGSFGPPVSRVDTKVDFELPDPAMKVPSRTDVDPTTPGATLHPQGKQRSASMLLPMPHMPSPLLNIPGTGEGSSHRPRLSRLFTGGSPLARQTSNKHEFGMQNLDYVRTAEVEFFSFLDIELEKIETFYKQKEDQASKRLVALREQLHEMRNRRTEEIAEAKRKRELEGSNRNIGQNSNGQSSKDNGLDWINPLKSRLMKPGPNSEALHQMVRTPVMAGRSVQADRDYVRRPHNDDVPYRVAKRKLKLALQEFYRGLELLKSYALLNRTAFRKLNKKYDKTVNARPLYRYMTEKVNKSWFVNSDILDGHIQTVEDLYARYFERGNHKVAAGKLRDLIRRPGDASGSTFRSGLLIGFGAVFTVQGLIYGAEILFDDDDDRDFQVETSYLLQLYGGYFLILLMFALFTLACRIWTRNKVNYPFIFEFDTRNNLEWKQLAEFPSFFFALFGLFIWLNFSGLGDWEDMFLYFPTILICISLLILFLPFPILHHKARRWFLYSHYRLLLAGLYPVEFRDFFLGDIWCSLTYATCNISLFFCLYANEWENPGKCNSNHSRLMGFFAALPPIWRALQCIRRYYDTKNVFPHLVNCGKYTMTIFTAIFLSLYRINGTQANLALFIAFATINAVYCSIWDLFMDFSLLQTDARHPLLRDILAIKKSVWIYYVIMVVDPILRFSWIFYAIFTHNTQHSTIISFMVAAAEVTRRGMWTVLRVENEHCGNVAQYKASRDTPLPYTLGVLTEQPSLESLRSQHGEGEEAEGGVAAQPGQPDRRPSKVSSIGGRVDGGSSLSAGHATGVEHPQTPAITPGMGRDEEEGYFAGVHIPGVRRRPGGELHKRRSILKVMAEAHMQDFEKKRQPEEAVLARRMPADEDEDMIAEDDEGNIRSDQEEDDDDESTNSMREARMQAREAEPVTKRGRGTGYDSDSSR